MKPAISTSIALATTFCLIGTKTRNELPVLGTSAEGAKPLIELFHLHPAPCSVKDVAEFKYFLFMASLLGACAPRQTHEASSPDATPTPSKEATAPERVSPETSPPSKESNTKHSSLSHKPEKLAGVDPEQGTQENETGSAAPRLFDKSGSPLPQTRDVPQITSSWFKQSGPALFEAIVKDEMEIALSFFFPREAYAQVKDIPEPEKDWDSRLKASFRKDVHRYHRALGKFRSETKFVEIRVAEELSKWILPGKEVNKVGYYRVLRSVIVYRDREQRLRELALQSMISWRGEWYVVHLAPL